MIIAVVILVSRSRFSVLGSRAAAQKDTQVRIRPFISRALSAWSCGGDGGSGGGGGGCGGGGGNSDGGGGGGSGGGGGGNGVGTRWWRRPGWGRCKLYTDIACMYIYIYVCVSIYTYKFAPNPCIPTSGP